MNRDRLPFGKQILSLKKLTVMIAILFFIKDIVGCQTNVMHFFFSFCSCKFKLEDGVEVKPTIPLFDGCINDNKLYMISNTKKVL